MHRSMTTNRDVFQFFGTYILRSSASEFGLLNIFQVYRLQGFEYDRSGYFCRSPGTPCSFEA